MSSELMELKERLKNELKSIAHLPPGFIYKDMCKNLGKILLELGEEMEAIFYIAESLAISLRTRASLTHTRVYKDDKSSKALVSVVAMGGICTQVANSPSSVLCVPIREKPVQSRFSHNGSRVMAAFETGGMSRSDSPIPLSESSGEDKLILNPNFIQHNGEFLSKGVRGLMERIRSLPEEWTVVQVSYCYDPALRFRAACGQLQHRGPPALNIIRFQCGKHADKNPPYLTRVEFKDEDRFLEAELHSAISDFKKNRHANVSSLQQYYKNRAQLDVRMKNVVQKLQENWLQHWVCLFITPFVDGDLEQKAIDFVDQVLSGLLKNNSNQISVSERSRRLLYLLAKASIYIPWDLQKGVAACLNISQKSPECKEITNKLKMIEGIKGFRSSQRHPLILLIDEDLELFPWEMLLAVWEHPVYRMPSLHLLHALFKAHESNIVGGRYVVDAGKGYFLVNPQQNLPKTEKHLRPFLTKRTPHWKGKYSSPPTSEEFQSALEDYSIFIYSGHGSGSEFLSGDDIQRLKVKAVTFLFGCSSITSKEIGGIVEPTGMWHFYLIAGCPLVVGNLWEVTDNASDAICINMLDSWLPPTEKMLEKKGGGGCNSEANTNNSTWKQEPELLYAIQRCPISKNHYMPIAALVARGLPVICTVSVT